MNQDPFYICSETFTTCLMNNNSSANYVQGEAGVWEEGQPHPCFVVVYIEPYTFVYPNIATIICQEQTHLPELLA